MNRVGRPPLLDPPPSRRVLGGLWRLATTGPQRVEIHMQSKHQRRATSVSLQPSTMSGRFLRTM
jgi:hypothetical protein